MAVTGAEARKDGRDGRALLVEASVEAENERFWVRTDCIVTNRGELRVFIWERMKESGAIGELVAKKKKCGVWSVKPTGHPTRHRVPCRFEHVHQHVPVDMVVQPVPGLQ
jgi:hypothetical protein